MPFNGVGTYLPAGADYPVVTLTVISSLHYNNVVADMSTAISTCVTKDGQTVWTANLAAGGFKLTGLGAGTARTDAANMANVQDGLTQWVVAGGTADAITATYSPTITTLVDGQTCSFRATAANATITPTFAPNGLTARTITKNGGGALQAGDIPAALAEIKLRYNLANTRWELLSSAVNLAIPQNSQSAAYTTVLTDSGKHILHPTADNNARTFTIDSNANIPYPVGTVITFVNQINTVTIAITSDTLTFAGFGTTGSRTLAASGIATALKIASTSWIISGQGLS